MIAHCVLVYITWDLTKKKDMYIYFYRYVKIADLCVFFFYRYLKITVYLFSYFSWFGQTINLLIRRKLHKLHCMTSRTITDPYPQIITA